MGEVERICTELRAIGRAHIADMLEKREQLHAAALQAAEAARDELQRQFVEMREHAIALEATLATQAAQLEAQAQEIAAKDALLRRVLEAEDDMGCPAHLVEDVRAHLSGTPTPDPRDEELVKLRGWLGFMEIPLQAALRTVRPTPADSPANVFVEWHTGADTVAEICAYLATLTPTEEPDAD